MADQVVDVSMTSLLAALAPVAWLENEKSVVVSGA